MAKAKVTDVTGRVREQMIKDSAEALAARANEISMATAAQEYNCLLYTSPSPRD